MIKNSDYDKKKIVISIVSHGHEKMLSPLLFDIERYCSNQNIKVVLTLNIEENLSFRLEDFKFESLLIKNSSPKGFGANHNTAFQRTQGDFFCVLNPDIRLLENPFPILSSTLKDLKIGVVAPLVIDPDRNIEDNARSLPTPFRLLSRLIRRKKNQATDYKICSELIFADWVAGIFMMFSSKVFTKMNGFDERYHLYFEDVDLCSRLRLDGYQIILDPRISVVHNARRDSHKNFQYLRWHILSGMRFFSSRVFWNRWLFQFKKKVNKT